MLPLSRRVVVTVAALALAARAADDKPQPPPPFKPVERNSLEAMTRGDSIFHTAYLNPAVEVGGTKARHISMTGADEAGVFLSLDPNVGEISPYGDYRPITEIAPPDTSSGVQGRRLPPLASASTIAMPGRDSPPTEPKPPAR